jgi:hypothetical protein
MLSHTSHGHSSLEQLGHHAKMHLPGEESILNDLCEAFENASVPLAQRLETFPRHVRRQDLARFLVRYEIFKLNLGVHGSVVECGVFAAGGLMTWMHCSSILEPYNHTRRVIGFDTFTGFPKPHQKDTGSGTIHVAALFRLADCRTFYLRVESFPGSKKRARRVPIAFRSWSRTLSQSRNQCVRIADSEGPDHRDQLRIRAAHSTLPRV